MKLTDLCFALSRFILDATGVLLAFLGAYLWRMQYYQFGGINFFRAPETIMPISTFFEWAFPIVLVILIVFIFRGEYKLQTEEKLSQETTQLFFSLALAFAVVLAYFFFAQWHFFSRLIFGLAGIIGLVLLILGRIIVRQIRFRTYQQGLGQKKLLIIGEGKISNQVLKLLKTQPQYVVVKVLKESDIKKLEIELKNKGIDEVWLASDLGTKSLTDELVQITHIHHKKFQFFPDELGMDLAAVSSSTFLGIPILTLLNTKLDGWGLVIKTIFDLILGIIALLIITPVLGIVALLVWKENPKASIIYKSKRVGKNSQHFDCYKFRTMIPDADQQKKHLKNKNERGDVLFKMKDDPRVTNIGHWLRKFSLDELPQIFNVLRLEMSFIGPRPHLVEEVAKYPDLDRQVLSIRPGISGFAQINGRSSLSFNEEMRYEMYYLKNWSLLLDTIIFVKSIWVVITGKDAS